MRVRRVLASVAAAATLAGGVSLAVAPGASAADLGSHTVACNTAGGSAEISITGQVGDTFTVTSDGAQDCNVTSSTAGIVSWTTDDNTGRLTQDPIFFCGSTDCTGANFVATTVTITLLAAGLTTWVAKKQGFGLTIHFSGPVASAPAPAPASVPIPPWVQAYGIFHHDEACLPSWTNSWQMWAEPITGGWVCTRSIPSLG